MGKPQILYLFSQVLLACFNWIVLIVLAKKFSPTVVGEYSLVLAWLAPIFLLYSMQMKSHFLTHRKASINDYFSLRVILVLPLTVICFVLMALDLNKAILLGVFVLKLSELLFEIPFMLDQKKQNLLKGSTLQILRTLSTYILLTLLIYKSFSFEVALIISSSSSLLFAMLYTLSKELKIDVKFNRSIFKQVLPLGCSAFLVSFMISAPRIFLKFFRSIDEVALFTVIFSFYAIWQLLFNNYFNGILDKLSSMSMKKACSLPSIVFLFSAVIFYFFDEAIYRLVFGENFIEAKSYTLILLVNILISLVSSTIYYRLLSQENYHSHFGINLKAFLLALILLPVMIYNYGVMGALIGQGIIQLFQTFLYVRLKK